MDFPRYLRNSVQERVGINAVASSISHLGLIWRETPRDDVGIDGQIEYVDSEGNATGNLIAVQVKSGQSYLRDHDSHWRFYTNGKHRFYWERFPLPVLIALHDSISKVTYWADARQQLRSPSTAALDYIIVPKTQVLEKTSADALFAAAGVSGSPFLDLEDVLKDLIATQSGNASFPISYFDLFANGLTNICRSLYFGTDLACEVAEALLELNDSGAGLGVGETEHQFLFGYTQFLVQQHIADVDFADCLIDWYDRLLQPQFLAPLTSRGRSLVQLIQGLQNEYQDKGLLKRIKYVGVAQEDYVRMYFAPSHYARIPLINEFQQVFVTESSGNP